MFNKINERNNSVMVVLVVPIPVPTISVDVAVPTVVLGVLWFTTYTTWDRLAIL